MFLSLALVLYGRGLNAFFLADDFNRLRSVAEAASFELQLVTGANFVRPMVLASFWLDHRCWGLEPLGFHVTNLLLHVGSSLLVVSLLRSVLAGNRARDGERELLAIAAGLVFLVLPCHSEAVAWISGRSDLLATFFGLASLLAHRSFLAHCRPGWLVTSLGLFALSLMAKESVVTLPWIVALLATSTRESTIRESRCSRLLMFGGGHGAVLAVYLVARYLVLGSVVGGYGQDVHLALSPLTLLKGLLSFSARTIVPDMAHRTHPILVLGVLGILALARARHRSRQAGEGTGVRSPLLLFTLSFVVALVPVLNLGISKVDTQGERLLYLPSVFASVSMVLLLRGLFHRRSTFLIALGVASAVWCFALVRSVNRWREAGSASRSIVHAMSELGDHDRLVIAHLPDSIAGAYVFRNGLSSARSLFCPGSRGQPVRVITTSYLYDPWAKVSVTPNGLGLSFEIQPQSGHFLLAEDAAETAAARIGSHGFLLETETLHPGDRVVGFTGGTLRPVD